MFEAFYSSFWQHPLLLWLFPLLFGAVVRPGGSFFERSVLVLLVLSVVDPLMTGPVTQLLSLSEGQGNAVMILFVLLGDFRFFFFVERFGRPEEESRKAYVVAALLSFVVPLLQAGLIEMLPEFFENPRRTFLAYELLFLGMASVYRFFILPGRSLPEPVRRWLQAVSGYVMIYYALWAAADVVILAGADFGFLLRVFPNVLYYGLFVPFVWFRAPDSLKAAGQNELGFESGK